MSGYSVEEQNAAVLEEQRLSSEAFFQQKIEELLPGWTEAGLIARLDRDEVVAYVTQMAWARLAEWFLHQDRRQDYQFSAIIAWMHFNTNNYPLFLAANKKITSYLLNHDIDGSLIVR
jgi:hypothetical protein